MNNKLLRRFIGLLLTALLLVGVFVLAATSAAKGSSFQEMVSDSFVPPTPGMSKDWLTL